MKKSQNTAADTDDAGKPDRQFVNALARGLEILRCFNAARTELGTMEIAKLTGLPQPTVWRLCHTLVKLGYLAPSFAGDKLRIATGVLSLGYSALAAIDIGETVQQGMQRLADELRAASSLAAADRLEMVIVRRATAADAVLLVNLHVGSRLDMATSSFGWAYLAVLPQERRGPLLTQLKQRHGTGWPEVLRRIQSAQEAYEKRGYILNSGVYHRDINAIAVPIVPANGSPIMSLNIGGPAAQVPVRRLEKEVAPRLIQLAQVVQAALEQGGRGNMTSP